MGLFDQLTGGHQRQDYKDFSDRYDQGRPHEGYDDEEVTRRYQEVSSEADPDTYRDSARQSFERMDPQDRQEFGRQLNEHARGQGIDTGHDGADNSYEDPNRLAEMTSRVHQQSPGLLTQLLNGAGGGAGGGLGGLLGGVAGGGNPIAKAAIAGIAAYASKQMMGRR